MAKHPKQEQSPLKAAEKKNKKMRRKLKKLLSDDKKLTTARHRMKLLKRHTALLRGCIKVAKHKKRSAKPISEQRKTIKLMNNMEKLLFDNNRVTKQNRDQARKTFNLKYSFMLGRTTNALGAGNKKSEVSELAFASQHTMKGKEGKGVFMKPVMERKLPGWKKKLWILSKKLIKRVDYDFAKFEDYVVNYSCINHHSHYVKKHKDDQDISYQYLLALGNFTGANLRCYDENDNILGDFDNKKKICKMDGRLPHELIMNKFKGIRFSIIWFKLYDRCKFEKDPLFKNPHFV